MSHFPAIIVPLHISFDKQSNVHKLISQILSKSILKQVMGKKDIETKELFLLSKSLKEIMSSTKDREKIESDLRKEIKAETIKKVEDVAGKVGLSTANLKLIKEALKD